ncbi:MAG: CheR family methyltransferase [Alphaproteobacteria bacterium]|nr:CheR family methyltransferase [Alphaproteobacteria bacterium]
MLKNEIYGAELDIFLEAMRRRFGYDFTDYAKGSLKRRVLDLKNALKVSTISELVYHVFHDEDFLPIALKYLSVQFSEIFRDPHFYKILREEVVPVLKTYPQINIWVAGCANGEEAYSMAILLKEEGLFDRSNIYATDLSQMALDAAREGVYPLEMIDLYNTNYQKAGGKGKLSDYFVSKYQLMAMDPVLREIIFFSEHNLTVDSVFCEMHLVICRNVLIYFNKRLQEKCLALFDDSLVREGYLGLGEKESIEFSERRPDFVKISDETPLFRKRASSSRD